MCDKIPVFDNLGNQIGDFIPTGKGGETIAMVLVGLAICLLYLMPFLMPLIMFLIPTVGLLWSHSRPKDYPNRNLYIFLCLLVLSLEVCGFLFLAPVSIFCSSDAIQSSKTQSLCRDINSAFALSMITLSYCFCGFGVHGGLFLLFLVKSREKRNNNPPV